MKLHDNVRKALSFAVFAGGQELWSHGFRWADALVKGVFFFLLWWVGSTVRDRWRARRAEAEKDRCADLVGDLGEFGKPGGGQGGGVETG